jgi:hypothetical protein
MLLASKCTSWKQRFRLHKKQILPNACPNVDSFCSLFHIEQTCHLILGDAILELNGANKFKEGVEKGFIPIGNLTNDQGNKATLEGQ